VDELIKIIILILVFGIPALGKLLSSMREQKRPGMPPMKGPQPPAMPQQQRPPLQQQQPQVQFPQPKSVKDEIEEFLRRAAQKQQQGAPVAGPPRRAPQPAPQAVQQPQIVKAEVVRRKPFGTEISEHAQKFLDDKEFDDRSAKLGSEVTSSEKKMEQHLKQMFGKDINKAASLAGDNAAPAIPLPADYLQDSVPALATAGVGLAAALNNIDSLRQAIVLNEILQRPSYRWE
jgi:hypothetical protein